ncbi:hypothetical protein GCM10010277_53840 [Streptomyces longisporoflavus]|nr:hypothetical protein GCM10010277_53840 [Streptomyces longisporoflavus]
MTADRVRSRDRPDWVDVARFDMADDLRDGERVRDTAAVAAWHVGLGHRGTRHTLRCVSAGASPW